MMSALPPLKASCHQEQFYDLQCWSRLWIHALEHPAASIQCNMLEHCTAKEARLLVRSIMHAWFSSRTKIPQDLLRGMCRLCLYISNRGSMKRELDFDISQPKHLCHKFVELEISLQGFQAVGKHELARYISRFTLSLALWYTLQTRVYCILDMYTVY